MGLQNNNNIRKLYTIKNGFNDFRYFFYHTSLNLFLVVDIIDINEHLQFEKLSNDRGDKVNYNEDMKNNLSINEFFLQKFKENKSIDLNFSKYNILELSSKLNFLRDIYVNLQNSIFSSHYKSSLDMIFNLETEFIQINKISNQLSVTYTKKYFFECINLFFNHGKVIVDSIQKTNNAIKLFIINSINGKIDFGEISNKFNLGEIQLKMYEIIINYINYNKNFLEIGELMNTFFSESLTEVFNSTYLLSFILMGVHLILFVGGILIIQFLHKIIAQNDKMLSISNDQENLKFMRDKLKSIKNLSLLFVENPKNLVTNINNKKNEYMKKILLDKNKKLKINRKLNENSENNQIHMGNVETENFLSEIDEYEIHHKRTVSYLNKIDISIPFVYLFLILFALYYTYSFIFYFIFRGSYNDFNMTSEFQNQNTDLDNKIMNNINLLSTMMMLNKTEFDVSHDLTGKKNKIMMELLTNILKTRTDITKYKKTNSRFMQLNSIELNLMNCSYIYNNLNDSILFDIEQIQLKSNFSQKISNNISIKESMTEICKMYSFMNTKKLDSIFDEISYNSLHLYNLYDGSNKTYSEIKSIHENFMFYDVFLILLVIFRPIRKYSSDYVFENIIMMSSSNYLIFMIIYLILNIGVDLIIFYIINQLVVKKISDINKHLNNMIVCISFKFSSKNNKEKKN